MAGPARAVDPDVLEDLRLVEQCSRHLEPGGLRPEFWEVFSVLKADRQLVQNEARRLAHLNQAGYPGRLDPAFREKLQELRRDLYPLAQRLREFLSRTELGQDGMRLELAIVFVMSSPGGRAAAARWVADPAAYASEAALRMRVMGRMVDAYRRALRESRFEKPPEPAPTPGEGPVPAPVEEPPRAVPRAEAAEPSPHVPALPPIAGEPAEKTWVPAPPSAAMPVKESPSTPPQPAQMMSFEQAPGKPSEPDQGEPGSGVQQSPGATFPLERTPVAAPPAVAVGATPSEPPPSATLSPAVEPDSTLRILPQLLDDLRRVLRCRALFEGMRPEVELWELVCLIVSLREETRTAIRVLEVLKERGRPGEFAGAAYAFREKVKLMRERYGLVVEDLRDYLRTLFGNWVGETEELALALLLCTAEARRRVRQWLQNPEGERAEALKTLEGMLARARKYQEALQPDAASSAP